MPIGLVSGPKMQFDALLIENDWGDPATFKVALETDSHRTFELIQYHKKYMRDLVFKVVQDPDGGYCAECLTENIFTEGDTWDELRYNVHEASSALYP